MKYLIIAAAIGLTACSTTVPVKRTFPEVPEELTQQCPDLKSVPEGTTQLSDVISVVADNYAQYKECQIKTDLWKDWYEKQRKIFDEVK